MNDHAFVELRFTQKTIDTFDKFLNSIISKEQFYYSPVVEHIRGNMSKTLHCTVFFGLNVDHRLDAKLIEVLSQNTVEDLELGKLSYIDGYENLYKVLIVEVLDSNGKLHELLSSIEEYVLNDDPNFKIREFRPHLTLAYVANDFVLPDNLPELPRRIDVSKVRINLVSEFNKEVNAQNGS